MTFLKKLLIGAIALSPAAALADDCHEQHDHSLHGQYTYPSETYPTQTYPTQTYPTQTYPTHAYPQPAYPQPAYPTPVYPTTPVVVTPQVEYVAGRPAPPPLRYERVRARRNWVWVQGHWDWRRGRYVWVSGHWERAKRFHRPYVWGVR